jgi:putative CocE/NonD family hydrolase
LSITWEQNLELRLSDGDTLRADVWRPAKPGRYPTLLIREPYGKRNAENVTYAHPSWYAQQGFAVVAQDVRGRGESDGEFVPFGTEAEDGEATIGWVAEQAFCNGSIGMYGFSYGGATQLQAASRRPAALKAMVPALTSADYYEGWAYKNGALSLAFVASWASMLAAESARRHGDVDLEMALLDQFLNTGTFANLPLAEYPNLTAGGVGGFFKEWLEHPTNDEFWRKWNVADELANTTADALCVAGLYDIFLDPTLDAFRRLAERSGPVTELIVTPWYHIPWSSTVATVDYGPAALNRIDEWQLDFFSRTLRGDGTSRTGDQRVRAFITGRQDWVSYESWPPPSEPQTFYLHGTRANSVSGDGLLTTETPGQEPPDVFTYDPASPSPSLGGRSCCFPTVSPMGPVPQNALEVWNSLLVYTSRPLERDLLVVGEVVCTLFAATSEVDTDWVFRLCDVGPEGMSINITDSIQRARFRDGTDEERLLPADEVAEFTLRSSCAHLFRAGHRLRLHVTSSSFPMWDRNLNTGGRFAHERLADRRTAVNTVFHDDRHRSHLTLPALG